jgi:hypothetical protein
VPKVTKVNDFVSVFKMKERSDTPTLSTLAHFRHLKLISLGVGLAMIKGKA